MFAFYPQEHLDDRHVYTKKDMVDLVMLYRDRFNEELEQIKLVEGVGIRQNQSRQHASREATITMAIEENTHQFEGSGIEVPDLINKKHLEAFKKWNGDSKYIQNLKMRKISKLDLQRIESKEEEMASQCDETESLEDIDNDENENAS